MNTEEKRRQRGHGRNCQRERLEGSTEEETSHDKEQRQNEMTRSFLFFLLEVMMSVPLRVFKT